MTRRDKVKQSIRRTARSHPDDCECRTCRAANGDQEAMDALIKHLI